MKQSRKGFTLVELLVVILIIGVLAAIALPMYQKAVLKSRFSAMMPIAKAMAESNEVYYLDHGNYSENPEDLVIQGKDTTEEAYPDGTTILMYSNADDLSFVRTENANVPNARYVVYQKHSKNFADTTWCEAGDERAEEMCQALGGVIPAGISGNSSGEDGWKAYLLSGQVREGDSFAAGNGGTRTLSGTPICDNLYGGGKRCYYTYTTGETMTESAYGSGSAFLSCSNMACRMGFQPSTGDGYYEFKMGGGKQSLL